MPRYRVIAKDNPSEGFEDDFDGVLISGGMWVFARNRSANAVGAGQTFGSWSVSGHTVEIEDHGGTWLAIDPETLAPGPSER